MTRIGGRSLDSDPLSIIFIITSFYKKFNRKAVPFIILNGTAGIKEIVRSVCDLFSDSDQIKIRAEHGFAAVEEIFQYNFLSRWDYCSRSAAFWR